MPKPNDRPRAPQPVHPTPPPPPEGRGSWLERAARCCLPGLLAGVVAGLFLAWGRWDDRGDRGTSAEAPAAASTGPARGPGAQPKPVAPGADQATRTGAWGTLDFVDIKLEPPSEYIEPELCTSDIPVWKLPDFDRAELARLLSEARLSPSDREALERTSSCAEGPNGGGCVLTADLELTARLDLHARGVLYRALARHPENPVYFYAFRRRPSEVDGWFAATDLSPVVREQVRALMFPVGEYLSFADRPLICSRLTDAGDRRAFLKALARTPSLLVQLRIPEGSDVGAIADYWNRGGRRKDVLPLLESIARNRGGGSLDIGHLLPGFARARLFTYPTPVEPPWDCHWSSMNFFANVPDDRFLDPDVVRKTAETQFAPIHASEARLGDVVVFAGRGGRVVHSAVYVAADIVFTKNGASYRRPWVLMRLADVIAGYFGDAGVSLRYLRRKLEAPPPSASAEPPPEGRAVRRRAAPGNPSL